MAKRTFLDFEQPIAELETKIEELRYVQTESAVDISEEIDQLGKKSQQLTKDIYSQPHAVADHQDRAAPGAAVHAGLRRTRSSPTSIELHGDRHFADDLSIVGGLARFNGKPCMVLGHQKGRDTKERGAAQLRHEPARGLPQGAAPDEDRREVQAAGLHLRRHARRLPRHRRRGARPVRGDRPQHLRDGAARSADHHHHHRRGRLGRRAGDLGRRPGADAAVLDLLGDQARRLRVDPLEDVREGAGRRRCAWASRRTA